MKKILLTILILLIVVSTVNAKGMIVIGLDGVGLNTLNRLVSQNKLLNIQQFLNEKGTLFPMFLPGITFTIPQWSKIFTGLDDYQTGVRGNKSCDEWNLSDRWRIFDTSAFRYRMMECFQRQIPLKHTLQGKLKSNGFVSGWFIAKDYLGSKSNMSPFTKIAKNSSYKLSRPNDRENYNEKLESATISFINNHKNDDFVVFMHFNPDYYGHRFGGESGERYEYEIIRSDNIIGNILNTINDDVKTIIISDHGFDSNSTTHDNADDAILITDLPVRKYFKDGGITTLDITPTILSWFGIEWKEFHRKGKNVLEY